MSKGIKVVLATNPIFPEVSTITRCEWIDLSFSDFAYVSHANNSHYSKPNPIYYQTLLDITGSKAENTLMVGNDFHLDMAAKQVGISTWMIDKNHAKVEDKGIFEIDHEGSIEELVKMIYEKE